MRRHCRCALLSQPLLLPRRVLRISRQSRLLRPRRRPRSLVEKLMTRRLSTRRARFRRPSQNPAWTSNRRLCLTELAVRSLRAALATSRHSHDHRLLIPWAGAVDPHRQVSAPGRKQNPTLDCQRQHPRHGRARYSLKISRQNCEIYVLHQDAMALREPRPAARVVRGGQSLWRSSQARFDATASVENAPCSAVNRFLTKDGTHR